MPRSFDMSIGRWASIDGRDGIALIVMSLLMVSAFGPFGLDILWDRSNQRPPTTRAASPQSETAAAPVASAQPAQESGPQPAPGAAQESAEWLSDQFAQPANEPGAQASAQGHGGQPAHPAQEPGAQATSGTGQAPAQWQRGEPAQDRPETHSPSM